MDCLFLSWVLSPGIRDYIVWLCCINPLPGSLRMAWYSIMSGLSFWVMLFWGRLLYKFFPNQDEGFLTRVRSKVVSRESLNDLAIHIGLNKAVVAKADLSRNKHIYGDVFEAFVGAMFLDQGFTHTKRFIEKYIFPNYFDIKDLVSIDKNYKSRLIEWGQKNKVDLIFNTESTKGRRNKFCCTICIGEEEKGKGYGSSKKEAEQSAAEYVIRELQEETRGNIEI